MTINPKIKTIEELALKIKILKTTGKKVIHCHGVFDLLHPGHVRHFYAAKALGEVLVVTVTPDRHVNKGPGRPVFTELLRAESVAALEAIDYVAINLWPNAVETIKKLAPDVYVKGKDYIDAQKDETGAILLEKEAAASVGCKMHFTDDITFSSSSLLNEYFGIYPEAAQIFLKDFRKRYDTDKVVSMLKSLKDLRVLVIGETILDEYAFVSPIGKPPKGNHIAARLLNSEIHAGGILACANHLANFCGTIDLVTAIGNDGREEFVRLHLKSNINLHLFKNESAPTIVKRRFVDNAFLAKLFEIYEIDDGPSLKLESEIKKCLGDLFFAVKNYNLILVLDYGHGLFTPSLRKFLCALPHFLAVNAQTNTANLGFNPITKYKRAGYFCLDDKELRLAYQDSSSNINILIRRLSRRVTFPSVITVTRGHLGATTYDAKKNVFFEAPVLSQKIVDTTGAGDAFFALTAPCVAKGFPLDLIPFIGNAAGALAVGILGNRSSIEAEPFFKFITALLK